MGATDATQLLKVGDVAWRLNVDRATVYRKISSGEIPALRIVNGTGPLRVDQRELERWLYGDAA